MIPWRRSILWLVACLVAPGSALAAEPARAPSAAPSASVIDDATRAAVRKLGDAGTNAYEAGDYELASEKLEKAFQLLMVPSLALWSARALAKRGLLAQAAERYLLVQRLDAGPGNPAVQDEARRQAALERAELMPRLPYLRVRLDGASAGEVSVSVDGAPLPALLVGEDWPANPGAHHVVGTRGAERVEASCELAEGQTLEVVLRFPHRSRVASATQADVTGVVDAAESGLPWRSIGWVTLGIGGATLVASGVVGIVASREYDALTSSADCLAEQCLSSRRSDVESYHRLVDVSTFGWISGAVLAGAGTLLVLTAPGSDVSVGLGPAGANVGGRF